MKYVLPDSFSSAKRYSVLCTVIRITHAPIIPEALACLSAISLRGRTRRSMNVRVSVRRIVIALREGVEIRDVGARVIIATVAVDAPVIVGELAFRTGYVIASGGRDAPFQPCRTRTIYGFCTRFRYQVPRFITTIEPRAVRVDGINRDYSRV